MCVESQETTPVAKVLQVTSKLFRGGAEAFIMNVYRNIDRSRVQFDFLVFHDTREFYEDEIERLGGRVYHVPVMEGVNLLRRKSMIDRFFDCHHDYVAVHGHMAALGGDYLRSAAEHGIERRFSHSHIADFERTPRNMVKQAFQRGFGKYATLRLACSKAAGEFMYPGCSFEVINNGIDVSRFAFDASRRLRFRHSLGFPDAARLIGHVGRFELMKNHDFLVEVFAALARERQDVFLVLAGDGSLRTDIEKKVCELGLEDRVSFLGVIDDMPAFYDAMDCFVMPSRSEGLPFSAIEAQCSGLPCVLSDRITDEVAITDLIDYLALESDSVTWAKEVALALEKTGTEREAYPKIVSDAGFSLDDTVARVMGLYL